MEPGDPIYYQRRPGGKLQPGHIEHIDGHVYHVWVDQRGTVAARADQLKPRKVAVEDDE